MEEQKAVDETVKEKENISESPEKSKSGENPSLESPESKPKEDKEKVKGTKINKIVLRHRNRISCKLLSAQNTRQKP